MVAAQAIDIKPPHQPALNLRVTDSVAFTACVLVSIQSIEQAIKDYDQGALVLALETYKDRHWRAVRAGVKPDTLQEKCKAAHIASVQTSLRCIAKANKNNDVEKRQVAIDGYQHAYDLAIADGIAPSNIKTKCNSEYYDCLTATLQAIARGIVTGDFKRRDDPRADWYEDDRHRMEEPGFDKDKLDIRMRNFVIKSLRANLTGAPSEANPVTKEYITNGNK